MADPRRAIFQFEAELQTACFDSLEFDSKLLYQCRECREVARAKIDVKHRAYCMVGGLLKMLEKAVPL